VPAKSHPFVPSQKRCSSSFFVGAATLPIECRQIEDADWQESWKAYVQPMPFGDGRLWICPSHRSIDVPGATVVTLDPGLAFGTGTHPSTALCLEWLARQDVRGLRVLDYGCGSGILGIAALKLGAAAVLAVDIDPQALTATRDNAERNGVSGQLDCALPAQAVEEPVDIVLANILARPLIELAPMLIARTLPGGYLVLAGLLESHADEVRAAYQAHFSFAADALQDGWSRLAARRLP